MNYKSETSEEYLERLEREHREMKRFIVDISKEEMTEIEDYMSRSHFYLESYVYYDASSIVKKLFPEEMI